MGNALRQLRKSKKWTLDQAAEKIGVSRGHYIKLERSERRLNESTAERASKAFKVSRGEVLGDERLEGDDSGYAKVLALHGAVYVPEIDVRAGASYAGGLSQEEVAIDESGRPALRDLVRAEWGFPNLFVRQELGAQPSRVHVLTVRGDSMAPTLVDGDRAVTLLDDTDLSAGGIFALLDDNASLIIKQVELVRTAQDKRRIRCSSRNTSYEPFELLLEEPVRIIGRVACKITKL